MADIAHTKTDQKLEEMEKRLSAIYSRAGKEIQKTADEYFSKFAKQDEAKRKLLEQGKITEDEYKKWRKGKVMYGKRFTEMKEQCAKQLLNVNQTALAYVNGELPEVYALNYNALESAVDVVGGYSFTLVDADTVRNLAVTDASLLPYKEIDPAKDIPWNMKKINSETLQGILQGESMDKIAKRIINVQEMNKTQAIRSARTIVTGAECKGRQDSYRRAKDDGIILRKYWLATYDKRARDWHKDAGNDYTEEKAIDIDDFFIVDGEKMLHPGDAMHGASGHNLYNCRCSIASKVVGFNKAQVQKAMAEKQMEEKEAHYNSEKINGQYKKTGYFTYQDYYSESQESFRLEAIKELSGFDDKKSKEVLDAFCGTRKDFLKIEGSPHDAKLGWFYGADTDIRTAKDGKWYTKAKTIDDYIMSAPKYEGKIYRGLAVDKDTLTQFEKGSIFTENGLLSSWTGKSDIAKDFATYNGEQSGKIPVIIESENPKYGTPVSHLSIFGWSEDEVIVSNMMGGEYIIDGVREENGIFFVKLIEKVV